MYEPITIPRKKCGQVYIMQNDIFVLNCNFCEDDFHNLEDFRVHLTEHFPGTPTNIKSEDSISLGGSEHEFTISEIRNEMNENLTNHQFYQDDFHNEENTTSNPPVADKDVTPSLLPSFLNNTEPIVSEPSANNQRRYQPKRQCKLYQSINENENLQISSANGQENVHYMFRNRVQRSLPLAFNLTAENKKTSDFRKTGFNCSFCSKTLSSRRQLSDHENTHTGNRPYKCTACSKDHASANNLNQFGTCRFGACSKTSSSPSFPLKGNKVHTDYRQRETFKFEIHKNDLLSDTDSLTNKCQYCYRTFSLVGNKTRHEVVCTKKSLQI